jgi:hypothetical protein
MSLSLVGPPGSVRPGIRVPNPPDRERWNAIHLPSGDQVAELPNKVNGVGNIPVSEVPSAFIRNKCEFVLVTGAPNATTVRLLSKTIFPFPSGDSDGRVSATASYVRRSGSEPSGCMMKIFSRRR